MAIGPSLSTAASNIPIPDPSEITSREIARAKTELREEFHTQIITLDKVSETRSSTVRHQLESSLASLKEHGDTSRSLIRELIETRLNAMDEASRVLSDNVNRVPTILDREALRLEKLFEEKLNGILTRFDGITVQFRERDIRTDQDKIAASTAVNAALQAQKEAAGAQNESNSAAITKSENSFTKEIDGLKSLIATTKDAIQSDVANLTGRLDRGEGGSNGARLERSDAHANIGTILGGLGLLVSIGVLIAMFTGHPAPVVIQAASTPTTTTTTR